MATVSVSSYRQYFDALPCYITIQNRDLNLIDANEQFRRDFGDIEGRFCYQVYKQRPEVCEVCPVLKTFQDGRPRQSEEQVRTIDGREVSVLVNTTAIRNSNGEIAAVMEMSTDITDIKKLQRRFKLSQERYQGLFEEVPCYISIQDRDLNIVEANRLHRETFGTYFGCKCYKVYKHRDKECHPCTVLQTFHDGQVHVHEEVVTGKDGNPINVIVSTSPLRNSNGDIDRVIEMSTDITQIRQLQSKLQTTGLLISQISHDLKGLLNGLDGGIYLVDTGLKKGDDERVKLGWEMVVRNVGAIRGTVLDILYYARDRDPDLQMVSVETLLDEVAKVMKSKASDNNIELHRSVDGVIGQFEADPKAIRSLLVNLVDNSIDACRLDRSEKEHVVSISASGTDDTVRFEIADNGTGMTREVREKAFTLFFSSKGSGGTGLGLFAASKIAGAHGGSISIDSEPDRGSTFIVEFPRRGRERALVSNGEQTPPAV